MSSEVKSACVVDLRAFDTTDEMLEAEHDGLVGGKCLPSVVVFPQNIGKDAKWMDNGLELIRIGFGSVLDNLSCMSAISEFNPNGDIDEDLKVFLKSFANTSLSIINSLSVRQKDMKEFHLFDVIDLQEKVETMQYQLKRALQD